MKNKLGLILGIVNTVVVLGVLGLFVYTKMIFKRPEITESSERKKLSAPPAGVDPKNQAKKEDRVVIPLDPITANLDPYQDASGKQTVHYLSASISIEIRSEEDQQRFEDSKPVILDQILNILAKKKFDDLNQVQGRYVFKSQIIDAANETMGEPIVLEVYFSDFILQ